MARFKYTVVTADGKKLNGSIDSPNENVARQDLNSLGFSIIGIEEVEETTAQQQEGLVIFEFEAFDKKGKKVVGTIPSADKYSAFKRLVQEYELVVMNICKGAASSYEKLQEKQAGVADLQAQLDQEIALANSKKTDNTPEAVIGTEETPVRDEERTNLQDQINLVMQKITEINQKYGNEISPEDKNLIDTQLNKLLRIRNSTNLAYVRLSCEELLKSVQDLEVLILNRDNDLQKSQLRFDISRMMKEIHKNTIRKSWREKIIAKIEIWLEKHPLEPKANWFEKWQFDSAQEFLSFLKETPEIRDLREKDFLISDQIKEYLSMYLKEHDSEIKNQIKTNISSLREKKKEIKMNVKKLKNIEREKKLAGLPENFSQSFLNEIYTFSGWLLAFYLVYYFVSIYLNTKDFGISANTLPYNFLLYKSTYFKYILAVLFITHSALSLKIIFFQKNTIAGIIIFPSSIIMITIMLLNL